MKPPGEVDVEKRHAGVFITREVQVVACKLVVGNACAFYILEMLSNDCRGESNGPKNMTESE